MSQFRISFPPSKLCFQTSATDSLSSRFTLKKSAQLCYTLLLGENCWQNNEYSLCNGSEPNPLFLSDRFRHLCKRFFSHRPLNNISCFLIQLLTVLLQYFFAICHCRKSISLSCLCTIQISAPTCGHWFAGPQSFSYRFYWNPVLCLAIPSSQSQ